LWQCGCHINPGAGAGSTTGEDQQILCKRSFAVSGAHSYADTCQAG